MVSILKINLTAESTTILGLPGTVVNTLDFHCRAAEVPPLLRKLRSHMLHNTAKETNKT